MLAAKHWVRHSCCCGNIATIVASSIYLYSVLLAVILVCFVKFFSLILLRVAVLATPGGKASTFFVLSLEQLFVVHFWHFFACVLCLD